MPVSIHVAVGVIFADDGRVLVAKRPPEVHQGDLWEFPGGKLEAGETVLQALQRELEEELGIQVDPTRCFPFRKISHCYEDRSVLLDVWRVNGYRGDAQSRENQPLAWCRPEQLDPLKFPAANNDIIRLLQLPGFIAITPACNSQAEFIQAIERMLARGIRLIQIRQPNLPLETVRQWVEVARQLCDPLNTRIMVNTSLDWFRHCSGHGLHLSALRLMTCRQRPVTEEQLFSASCHNSAELAQAERLGADFVLVSPVQATASHPGADILGWSGFQSLVSRFSIPAYALGGLSETDLELARQAGALGIASISAFSH
ncbi:MAG: Nudix family hydrolase [Gammaproteobacteria bacterium]|nr:Nudix family hydrolase [Pseudomonadales bacterium]MCP5345574.1 Nudix family hydrolase [Pseudomonadales bacterium]